jgi:ABC-2 type transport system ATP-binding protein
MAGGAVAEGDGRAAIRVRGLVKRYGDVVAVDGIDFEVRAGTCLGVLGPNGAGKTTAIEVLEGLKEPDAGEVEILGMGWRRDARAIRQAIGVQLQETDFGEKITVFETLRLFRSFYDDGHPLDLVIGFVGLEEKRDARVGSLSGGQRQRLALGCALLNRPRVLFLDEPTTGLDPQARRRIWEIVERFKAEGGTVLLTTHYMEEAERLADDLVVVDHGRVIARGTPRELVASLGAESVIEITPAEGAAGFDLGRLVGLPGVREVRREGERISLAVADARGCVAGIFGLIERRELSVEDLHTHRPTLEDVFVALTGKRLRDG